MSVSITVNTAAINTVSYHVGDIVIMGPPGGGACSQYGFVGFFGKNGTIQYAIATESSYADYTYDSETLSPKAGTGYDCTNYKGYNGVTGTSCTVPITYSLNGNSYTVRPGETKALSGTHFVQVSIIASRHTTFPPNEGVPYFSDTQLLHTMSFGGSALIPQLPQPTPLTPSGTSCPILSHNLARGSRNKDVLTLQTFLISQGMLADGSSTGYFGALTEHAVQLWQSSHSVVSSGTPSTTGYGSVGPRTRTALAKCNL